MKNQYLTKAASYLVICFAVLALISTSCKNADDEEEEQSGNGYKITFKVGGVAKEFEDVNFPPYGNFRDDGRVYTGSFAATGRASSVGFQVYDIKPIVVKEDYSGYTFTQFYPQGAPHYTLIEGSVLSYADGQISYSTQSITNPTVHVQLTEITATSARGTFSGTLKTQDGKTEVKITEGKFYVELRTPAN